MDPRLLQEDEFQLELEIRGIDKNHPQVVEVLCTCIEEEAASLRQAPLNLHSGFRTIVAECSEIQSKLSSIIITTGDFRELFKTRARYLHLLGRVNRLLNKSGSHALVRRLEGAIRDGLLVCSNWIENQLCPDSAESVRDNLEEEAQKQASSLIRDLKADEITANPPVSVQHSPKDQLVQRSQSASIEALETINPPALVQNSTSNEALGTNNPTNEITSNSQPTMQHSANDQLAHLGRSVPSENLVMFNEIPQSAPSSNFPTGSGLQRFSADNTIRQQIHLNPEVIIRNNDVQNEQLSPASNYGNGAAGHSFQFYQPVQSGTTINRIRPTFSQVPQYQATVSGSQQYQSSVPQFPVPGSDRFNDNMQGRMGRSQTHTAQGFTMSKWPLRFAGTSQDLPVDEFLFRAETLARLENLSHFSLALGLHQLLLGAASAWYWIYIRNEPYASWQQVKQALTFAFQSNISDAAIRRLIMDRLQRPGERFMDFCVAIQGLEVRLVRRMGEIEMLETLRRNMLAHLQDRLLFVAINSILELQQRVRQIEELAQRQAEVQNARRPIGRIHELSAPTSTFFAEDEELTAQIESPHYTKFNSNIDVIRNIEHTPIHQLPPGYSSNDHFSQSAGELNWINAIGTAANKEFRCWNCDTLGHTYMDCSSRIRKIFCYGCGEKNVVKPQCPKCSVRLLQGNAPRNVRAIGPMGAQRTQGQQTFRPSH